jgi:hypothetical protein
MLEDGAKQTVALVIAAVARDYPAWLWKGVVAARWLPTSPSPAALTVGALLRAAQNGDRVCRLLLRFWPHRVSRITATKLKCGHNFSWHSNCIEWAQRLGENQSMPTMPLGAALAAYMPRLGLRLLVVLALATLIPAWSHAAPVLTSADVSLTFGANPAINFGTLSPPQTEAGGITGCTINSTGTCTYSFSLTTTGFSFEELCTADDSCDLPTVKLDLTNLVFSPAQILTGVTLVETPVASDPVNCFPIDCASRTFTSNSVELSVIVFEADSGGTMTATGTFVTQNAPTSVPEPPTLPLLVAAVAGLALLWHRRSRAS